MSDIATSLVELIETVSAKRILGTPTPEDRGLAEPLPMPFLALVGQTPMKIALLLALINPAINGVLLIGPRGTGKTSAVRGLLGLLPMVERSSCAYGCLPEDIEVDGIDAVCPDCAKKYGEGQPLTHPSPVQLVELPLNSRIEDVVGGLDERAAPATRMMIHRGILSRADRNLLYIDEVNLLTNDIVDAILDAAAQGLYTVRRGPVAATYRARFALIGSMNPEEGRLRPQIMDRFGLRLMVHGLTDPADRLEAYHRAHAYINSPRTTVSTYAEETALARADVQTARQLLSRVELSHEAEATGLQLVRRMQIDSLRAEITMFEAARAYAAADSRLEVTPADVRAVAPLALRLRRSSFMVDFFKAQQAEEKEINSLLDELIPFAG